MATKKIETVIFTNLGRTPIVVSIAESKRDQSELIYTGPTGAVTIPSKTRIIVELSRVNFSHLKNLEKLGSIKIEQKPRNVTIADPPPTAMLDLSFTNTIGGPTVPMSPNDVLTGLLPTEFVSSVITITNDGDLDATVTTAVLDPASDATVNGFSGSTIANGGTNSFNLTWGGASPFDEDLTITINGTDYTFTFQGTIQAGGA